eukprot:Nitzschia sp. Nitz4//scaffold28_size193895//52773//53858//NITZ4_001643-RA/size193895-processed-gene-0.219-mRNA-1//1//CDS//3329545916//1445//frame0
MQDSQQGGGPFDPLRTTSANLLKQPPSELNPQESALQLCLQNYQQYRWQSYQEDDDIQAQDTLLSLYEALLQAYMDLEYWSDALGMAQTIHTYLQEGTDEYADSLHRQGKLWLRQMDFGHSRPLYEQALEYFQQSGNSVQQGHVLISLAGWYYFRNQLETAMEQLQQAEPLLDANPTLLVKCLDNQGLIYRLEGEFEWALDKYQQALQVVVDDETRLALHLHVADMYLALEESDQALALYHQLVREAEMGSNRGVEGVLWHNIANLHVERGEYDLAVQEFQRSLQLKQETAGEDHPEVGKTWNSLGALYYGILDEKVRALDCFHHALWIARIHAEDPKTDPDVMAALQTISDIEQQLKKDT